MADIDLIFNGSFKSQTETKLQCYLNTSDEIYIEIYSGHGVDLDEHQCIVLDKSTAIKLAKTLRTEINKIQD